VSIEAKAGKIRLVLLDVDGVLTDGTVAIHADGTESKTFDIKDGISMVWAQRAGLTIGILSARNSATTPHRAAQLGITLIRQGVPNKVEAYHEMVAGLGLDDSQVAYMGDDIMDLAVLGRTGLSAAPANAVEDVRTRVDWVSRHDGGRGAVRELLELILKAQGRWNAIVDAYVLEGQSVRS
jgi:3-deoxy-D-manno-octulosonate 8-phosphate phosphatase (KDO 8-P phosphatase)